MMIGIHLVLLLTASAQYAAVDAVRAAVAMGKGGPAAKRLLAGWGVVLSLIGAVAIVLSAGKDRQAPVGALVGSFDLEVGVGTYNLLAALVLLAVGVLMLAGALVRSRMLALVGGLLALAAAVSIYIQWGRTEIWLGATATTAAVFLCAAVVVAATAKPLTDR